MLNQDVLAISSKHCCTNVDGQALRTDPENATQGRFHTSLSVLPEQSWLKARASCSLSAAAMAATAWNNNGRLIRPLSASYSHGWPVQRSLCFTFLDQGCVEENKNATENIHTALVSSISPPRDACWARLRHLPYFCCPHLCPESCFI